MAHAMVMKYRYSHHFGAGLFHSSRSPSHLWPTTSSSATFAGPCLDDQLISQMHQMTNRIVPPAMNQCQNAGIRRSPAYQLLIFGLLPAAMLRKPRNLL